MSPDQNMDQLLAGIKAELTDVFAKIQWAEDEIVQASRRHPDQADALYHAFTLTQPRDIGPGMITELVYRSHVREVLERVATGADTRIATAAEVCLVCAQASLRVPFHGAAAGLYARMWLRAFPGHPITVQQADQQVHYESLHGAEIDDLERVIRRRAADPHRRLSDITCAGRHHGEEVACRYKAPLTSP